MPEQDAQWRAWLAAVRRQSVPTATSDDCAAVAEFAAELLRIGQRMVRIPGTAANALLRRQEGAVQWEIACDRKVFGDAEGSRPLKSLMVSMAEIDAAGGLENPRAFAVKAFDRLALSELRRPTMVASDDEGDDRGARSQVGASGVGKLAGPSVGPTALPATVAATLRHCARLAPVYSLAVTPVDPQPWLRTAGFIERDVALGIDRIRWPHGSSTLDLHACAWQATFHSEEGNVAYTGDDEVPAAGADNRGRFDQHTSRFRALWRTASGSAAAAVGVAAGTIAGGAGRVPASWDPPDHATLRGRR